jgi:hypothetical protein
VDTQIHRSTKDEDILIPGTFTEERNSKVAIGNIKLLLITTFEILIVNNHFFKKLSVYVHKLQDYP